MSELGKNTVDAFDKPAGDSAIGAPVGPDALKADPEAPSTAEAAVDAQPDTAALLAAVTAKAQEHYEAFLRAKAETDNARRRAREDVAKAHKFGIENFAEALLPVMDSLSAALADSTGDVDKLREGVDLTKKQLAAAFERNSLIEIDPAAQKFDPHRHQAIATVPGIDGIAPGHVVSVLQKGWLLADRVLRPALVTVASDAAPQSELRQ